MWADRVHHGHLLKARFTGIAWKAAFLQDEENARILSSKGGWYSPLDGLRTLEFRSA